MEQISLHPCLKHHTLINDLCSPLQSLGVTFFGYTALDSLGKAFCLGSKADYAEQYLKREHVKKDILVRPRDNKKNTIMTFGIIKPLIGHKKSFTTWPLILTKAIP